MKFKIPIVLLFFILCATGLEAQKTKGAYQVIYSADKDGNRLTGNLEELIDQVRSGNPIRVGYEMKLWMPTATDTIKYTLEHWADAGFISLHQGHVFAQINSIYGQGSSAPQEGVTPGIFLSSNKPDGWVAVIGTTGVLKQKMRRDEAMDAYMKESGMTEEQIEKQYGEMETSKFTTKWAIMTRE